MFLYEYCEEKHWHVADNTFLFSVNGHPSLGIFFLLLLFIGGSSVILLYYLSVGLCIFHSLHLNNLELLFLKCQFRSVGFSGTIYNNCVTVVDSSLKEDSLEN